MEIYCTRPKCPDPVNSLPLPVAVDQRVAQQHRFCSACAMPLILGGRFLPLQRIGSGSFGTTFLSIDLHSAGRRQCVVKQLRPSSELSLEQLEGIKDKFRQEAEVLETLGTLHPQIPSLYAFFELSAPTFWGSQPHEGLTQSEQYFYISQEYIDGQDLDRELKQKGKFSETEAVSIMYHLLPVLQFIHQHDYGVIHRDIKPGNIMRDSAGRLYLIDFGAVKQVTSGTPMESSIVLGTPIFSPPEQKSQKQVSPSSDLYSLAVTVLCLLNGYSELGSLFDPNTDLWNWREQIHVTEKLGHILDKMLQPLPSQRFQSASEILTILNHSTETDHFDSGTIISTQSDAEIQPIEVFEVTSKVEKKNQVHQSLGNDSNANPEPHLEIKHIRNSLLRTLGKSALLGSSGWILATSLVSFLGTILAPGFWMAIFGAFVFYIVCKDNSNYEKVQLFLVSLAATGIVFLLYPVFWNTSGLTLISFTYILLLSIVSALISFIINLLIQLFEGLKNN